MLSERIRKIIEIEIDSGNWNKETWHPALAAHAQENDTNAHEIVAYGGNYIDMRKIVVCGEPEPAPTIGSMMEDIRVNFVALNEGVTWCSFGVKTKYDGGVEYNVAISYMDAKQESVHACPDLEDALFEALRRAQFNHSIGAKR